MMVMLLSGCVVENDRDSIITVYNESNYVVYVTVSDRVIDEPHTIIYPGESVDFFVDEIGYDRDISVVHYRYRGECRVYDEEFYLNGYRTNVFIYDNGIDFD